MEDDKYSWPWEKTVIVQEMTKLFCHKFCTSQNFFKTERAFYVIRSSLFLWVFLKMFSKKRVESTKISFLFLYIALSITFLVTWLHCFSKCSDGRTWLQYLIFTKKYSHVKNNDGLRIFFIKVKIWVIKS